MNTLPPRRADLPRLVIEIAVEERPVIRYEAMSERDVERLCIWVASQAPMLRLIDDALRLASTAA